MNRFGRQGFVNIEFMLGLFGWGVLTAVLLPRVMTAWTEMADQREEQGLGFFAGLGSLFEAHPAICVVAGLLVAGWSSLAVLVLVGYVDNWRSRR